MQLTISCTSCFRKYRYSVPGGRVAMGFRLASSGWHIEGHDRLCPSCNPTPSLFDDPDKPRIRVRETLF